MADEAECHDVGKDAAGSVFPGDPRQLNAWTFEGYPPEQVLGVRFDEHTFAVFVADSLPEGDRDQILRDLSDQASDAPTHRADLGTRVRFRWTASRSGGSRAVLLDF